MMRIQAPSMVRWKKNVGFLGSLSFWEFLLPIRTYKSMRNKTETPEFVI